VASCLKALELAPDSAPAWHVASQAFGVAGKLSEALKAEWQKEKAVIDNQRKVKEGLDQARTELERVQRRGELGKASELQYGRIPELEKQLREIDQKIKEDFEKGDVVTVKGWILSVTEARQCALFALVDGE